MGAATARLEVATTQVETLLQRDPAEMPPVDEPVPGRVAQIEAVVAAALRRDFADAAQASELTATEEEPVLASNAS